MYKQDVVLNKQQGLIYHKTQVNLKKAELILQRPPREDCNH